MDCEILHQLERETNANEDVGHQSGVDREILQNKIFFKRAWKPLLNRRVLKILMGSSKGKTQRGQYLLAVGLIGLIRVATIMRKQATFSGT